MMWYDNGAGWGWWLLMGFGIVALWGFVAVAVSTLVRAPRDGSSDARPAEPDPRQVLDERFARGEIDADEYRARRTLLGSGR